MRARALWLTALLLAGCDLPRDPEGTLRRVRGGVLHAGAVENEPWVRWQGGRPAGVEVELVEELARELGAETRWLQGPEALLLAALERRELDLVVGGLTDASPWKSRLAFTNPYLTTHVVLGVPPGLPPPAEVSGLRVGVQKHRADVAAYVRAADGFPVPVDDPATASLPVAAERWRLQAWGLTPTDLVVHEAKHVLAAPRGENAWLVRVERFLLGRGGQVRDRLRAEAAR